MKPTFISLAVIVTGLSIVVTISGCGCLIGTPTPQATCGVTGGATLSSPAELGFGQMLSAQSGRNCLAEDGTCSRGPEINVTSKRGGPPPLFMAIITLPPVPMGVFDLTASSGSCVPTDSSCVSVTGLAVSAASVGLDVSFVSGTVDLQRSTVSDLDATFALEFKTAAGQTISVTDGQISMRGCHVESVCAE